MAIDRHPDALVSTAWLAAQLGDPDLRIFECTTYLRPAEPDEGVPYHPEAGRADYEVGHIPGAGFLDLPGELSRQDAPVAFMMLTADRFAETIGRHGVGDGTRVVLYSRDRAMWATRAWWMLHVMGFEAAVLDGGLEKWIAEGRPLSAEACTYAPATFTARPQPALMLDKDAVLGAIDAGRADRVVCYCGGGISATMGLFLLHRLGHRNLALYDASMAEWARDETLPIEQS